jgi:hypothetical protein
MKRAVLALCLMGAIVFPTKGASAQPAETAFIPSEQIEIYSVVVDTPQVITLPPASGEIWDILQSWGQLAEPLPATDQADLNEIELLKVGGSWLSGIDPEPRKKPKH